MRGSSNGFTLIELLVTLAVLGILVVIAVPSYQEWIRGNQITVQTNSLVTALNLARSEAIKRRGVNVILCKRNAGGTGCNDSGNWEDGWLLYVDTDNSSSYSSANDLLVRQFGPLNQVTVRTGTAFDAWLGFRPNGTPCGGGVSCASAGIATDAFRVCRSDDRDTSKARFVVVTTTGLIRTETCPRGSSCAYSCP